MNNLPPFFIRALAWLFIGLQWIPSTLLQLEIHTIKMQPSKKYQTLESFGTSAAWWAQHIDSEEMADEIARALYCKETGLGLDAYRYNVGGGDYEDPESRISEWDVTQRRRTQSFYIKNPDTGEFEYDFTRDENARRVLDKAIAYGASQVVLFCNSPHFSMTRSGHASGGLGGVTNLAPENYQAFVDYLLTVADWFVAQGYPVTGISPMNEPQWGWGDGWVGQEGCHYEPEEVAALMELFAAAMKERGSPYALLGPESGDMSEAHTAYTDAYLQNETINEFCDTFAGHSYWMDNNIWKKWQSGRRFKKLYPDKKFEMSEWCELPMHIEDTMSIDSGLYKANIIVQDLTLLNAVSWQSWVAVNGDGVMDIRNGELVYYNRYWAFKQFTSFIKPGAVRVKLRDSFWLGSQIASVAFRQPGETVLVMVNNSGKAQSIRLGGSYGGVKIYATDAERNCELIYEGALAVRQILPARSISTYILVES